MFLVHTAVARPHTVIRTHAATKRRPAPAPPADPRRGPDHPPVARRSSSAARGTRSAPTDAPGRRAGACSRRARSSCCWPTSTSPGVKPAEFLRDVRRRFPHVVVVVITGYGSIEGAVEATKIGAFDYLTKPIVDDEIRVVVEKAVRQQSLLFENHDAPAAARPAVRPGERRRPRPPDAQDLRPRRAPSPTAARRC